MSRSTEQTDVTRAEFLKLAAFGLGGVRVTALAGCKSRPAVVEGERQGYVVAVTHGPDDPTRVMLALATGSRLPTGDNHIWFSIDGGQIAKKEVAEDVSSPLFPKQGTAAEMIEELRSQGVQFHI